MATPQFPQSQVNHGKRVIIAWIVASLIATPIVAIFLARGIPPGDASAQGTEQKFDNTWLISIVTPVVCLILVYFAYTLVVFRHREGDVAEGPPLREHRTIQIVWLVTTSIVVIFLAGFGTYELLQNGAGGGQGPNPVAVPSGPKMSVQVIGQQWMFTYRYPSYGGVETSTLMLPENTDIELHVTSLDVVHSFWAYELGIKADANPGVDNVAYLKTKGPTTFHVHCAELCGLWHGYMFDTGHVVPQSQFAAWIKLQQRTFAPIQKYLPGFAHTYLPDPQRRAG